MKVNCTDQHNSALQKTQHLQFHSLYLNQDKWVCFEESCKIGSCRVCKCSMFHGFELMLRVCKRTWWTGLTQRDFVSVVPTLTRALTFPSASILQSVCVFPLGTFISHCPIVHLCPLLLLIMKNLFMCKSSVRYTVSHGQRKGGVEDVKGRGQNGWLANWMTFDFPS